MDEKEIEEDRERFVKKIKSFFKKNFSSEEKIKGEEKEDLAKKREELIHLFREKKQWLIYVILVGIIIFGIYIRTRNFWLLHDVTNGAWLSTDLDSHIYLKYAKEILAKGYLPAVDMMRFVPLGAPTANYAFPAYVIYYLYKILHFFNPTVTIEYADVIYPIVCFALGVFFFFLLARRLFEVKLALLSTLLLSIIPTYIQRTTGGSSDHDSLGMMFMFLSLYLFLRGWESKTTKKAVFWGVLVGISTGLTGLSWGAWKFLALIFSTFILIKFFLQKVSPKQIYAYGLWLIVSIIVMIGWVPLFTLKSLVKSLPTVLPLIVLLLLIVDVLLFRFNLFKIKDKLKDKVPLPLVSLGVSLALGVVVLFLVLGPSGMAAQLHEAHLLLLHPMGKDRWELTVAEQHQPYFRDITDSFGFFLTLGSLSLPLTFILFLVGLIFLSYSLFKEMRRKVLFTAIVLFFFLAILISRYAPGSSLDGVTNLSLALYFGGFILMGGLFFYYYWSSFRKDKEGYQHLLGWEDKPLYLLVWLLFMLVAARGAIRLILVVTPVVVLLVSYAFLEITKYIFTLKKKGYIYLSGILLLALLLYPSFFPFNFTGMIPSFAQNSLKQATYSGPPYDQQWQIAGDWVKKNLPPEAVFGHWWDYGYWVQNGWERASVLDGANKVKYWNYLMGRHVLTAENQTEALEFLYSHNTTHFLIVSEEIGKYTAYSSIGSDKNYDRYGWIMTFVLNEEATQETRNATVNVYQGSFVLDGDFVWENKVYPRGGAGIGAVFLPVRTVQTQDGNNTVVNLEFDQPTIALIQQGKRVDVPLECLYFNGNIIKFNQLGYKGCFRLMPVMGNKGEMQNPIGAGLFVSEKGVKALWVNLYVFNQKNPDYNTDAFESVYDDSYLSEILLYQGRLMGPIKIWKINYPQGFKISQELEERYLGGNELLPDYFFEV